MTLHSLTLQHVSASDCHHQGAQTKLKTIYNKPNYNKSAVMEFSHTVNSAVFIDLQINDTGQVLVHSSTQLYTVLHSCPFWNRTTLDSWI